MDEIFFYPIMVVPLPPERGPGYAGIAIDLIGCIAIGETPEQAFKNAQLASIEWIDEANSEGRPIPEPSLSTPWVKALLGGRAS